MFMFESFLATNDNFLFTGYGCIDGNKYVCMDQLFEDVKVRTFNLTETNILGNTETAILIDKRSLFDDSDIIMTLRNDKSISYFVFCRFIDWKLFDLLLRHRRRLDI